MGQGLKNLQTQSRSQTRRERLIDAASQPSVSSNVHYVSQSHHSSSLYNPSQQGSSLIHVAHPNSNNFNPHSSTSTNGTNHTISEGDSGISGLSYHTPTPSTSDQDQLEYENHMANVGGNDGTGSESGRLSGYGYHSHSSSGGSGGSRGGDLGNWGLGAVTGLGGRMDMGIEAIINRPNQGR